GPPPGRVLFISGSLETGTHSLTGRLAAFPDTRTHVDRLPETVLKPVLEFGLYLLIGIRRAVAEVLIDGLGVDNLARIHYVVRIKQLFHFLEGVIQGRSEKTLIVSAPHQSVAVFATPGAAIFYNQVEGVVG